MKKKKKSEVELIKRFSYVGKSISTNNKVLSYTFECIGPIDVGKALIIYDCEKKPIVNCIKNASTPGCFYVSTTIGDIYVTPT